MGCHTWCLRPFTKEEYSKGKQSYIQYWLKYYEFWDVVCRGKFSLVPWDLIAFDLDQGVTPITNYYSDFVYDAIYKYWYLDTRNSYDIMFIQAQEFKSHLDSLTGDEKTKYLEYLHDFVKQFYNYNSWEDFYTDVTTRYTKSFEHFCLDMKLDALQMLNAVDMSDPLNWTENDDVNNIERYSDLSPFKTGIVEKHNGKLYTDVDTPHDIFRIHDYNAAPCYSAQETFERAKNWKATNNDTALTTTEIGLINKFFKKYPDGVISFG